MAVRVMHRTDTSGWSAVPDPASLLALRGDGIVALRGESADTDAARWAVAMWSFVAHGGKVAA